VRAIAPLLPTAVIVWLPSGVWAEVASVSFDVPKPTTLVGLKAAVAPTGTPFAESMTRPLNPYFAVTVTVVVVLAPRLTVSEAGETETKKSPRTGTSVVGALAPVLVAPAGAPTRATASRPRRKRFTLGEN
jgi:hypothetical protein